MLCLLQAPLMGLDVLNPMESTMGLQICTLLSGPDPSLSTVLWDFWLRV